MASALRPVADRLKGYALLEFLRARCSGIYALGLYLPFSSLARSLRDRRRAARIAKQSCQDARIPQVKWHQVIAKKPISLVATTKRDGNVNLSEVAILAQAASNAPLFSEIVEIGTFDGRTTINLAINAPSSVPVFTIDLPSDQQTAYCLEASERQYVEKPASGACFREVKAAWRSDADRIVQMYGDSATFDWRWHFGKAGLVFIDGSHSYDYVEKDTETALRLVKADGVIFWHDYGVWPGVTRALEGLQAKHHLGLQHIRGTSLVFWRAPRDLQFMSDIVFAKNAKDIASLAPSQYPVDEIKLSTP